MACAGGKVELGQFDPILAPTSIRPWISCVGESESLFEDDFRVAHRESDAVLEPCYLLPVYGMTLPFTIASGEWRVNEGKALIFLTVRGYLLWFG